LLIISGIFLITTLFSFSFFIVQTISVPNTVEEGDGTNSSSKWNCSSGKTDQSNPFGPPLFLNELSADDLDKFCRICFDFNSTRNKVKANLLEWANETSSPQIQNEVKIWLDALEAAKVKIKATIKANLANNSEALELFNKIQNATQKDVTYPEICQAVQDIIKAAPPNVTQLVGLGQVHPGGPEENCSTSTVLLYKNLNWNIPKSLLEKAGRKK